MTRDRDVRWKRARRRRRPPLLVAAIHGHLVGLVILAGLVVVMATWR